MALTKEQVIKYVNGGGSRCPFCGTKDISARGDKDVSCDGSEIVQEIDCAECGKQWRDYYKLHNIEESEA